jgi:hypothetical protein
MHPVIHSQASDSLQKYNKGYAKHANTIESLTLANTFPFHIKKINAISCKV